tara:strand:+ start:1734 stop:1961 length:228 start_codon:yes stop_codon:yes gene_type:complete
MLEETSPTTDDVKFILLKGCMNNRRNKCDVQKVIDEVVSEEENKEKFIGWGSYRGFYTFFHSKLLQNCEEKIQKR